MTTMNEHTSYLVLYILHDKMMVRSSDMLSDPRIMSNANSIYKSIVELAQKFNVRENDVTDVLFLPQFEPLRK